MPYKNPADATVARRRWRDANRDRVRAAYRKWNAANKDKLYGYHIRRNYGITMEQKLAMLRSQMFKCAVCMKRMRVKDRFVDHDHKTGRVRGIVHNRCNAAMGQVGDNPVILRMAADYLESHLEA